MLRFRSQIVFACLDASCRPPRSGGTGGSRPSTPGSRRYLTGLGYDGPVTAKLAMPDGGESWGVKNVVKQNGAVRVGKQLEGKVDWQKDVQDYRELDVVFDYVTRSAMQSKHGDAFDDNAVYRLWEEFRVAHQSGPQAMARFSALYKETTGIPMETLVVARMQQAWGAEFGGPMCRDMMRSAQRLLPMSGEVAGTPTAMGGHSFSPRLIDRVVKQVYRNTQTDLRRLKVDEVTLVRGTGDSATAGRRPLQDPDNQSFDMDVALRPLSSYATQPRAAKMFGGGVYLSTRFKREQIFALSSSGFGCLPEDEVIVLGGTYPSTVGNDPYDLVVDA